MTHLDDAALDAIEQRADAATPGEWVRYSRDFRDHRSHSVKCPAGSVVSFEGYGPDGGGSYLNAEFIAHARTDIPALLAAVRDAQRRAQAAEAALQRVRELADSVEGIHNPGCEGEAECAACWHEDIRRALDAEQPEEET